MAPRSWLSGRWRRGGSGGRSTSARAALLPQGGWPTALAAVATAATVAAAASAAAAAAAMRAQDAASPAQVATAGLACTGTPLCAAAGADAPSSAQPCPLPPPRVGAGAAGFTMTSRLRGSTQELGRMAGEDEMLDDGVGLHLGLHGRRARTQATPAGGSRGC